MKRSCKRCSERSFEVPQFTANEKKTLLDLKSSNHFMQVISKIQKLYSLPLIDAKFTLMHISNEYGKCNRCNINELTGEYVTCSKCKSLNYNWKVK